MTPRSDLIAELPEEPQDGLAYFDRQIDAMWMHLRRGGADQANAAEWAKHTRNCYLRLKRHHDALRSIAVALRQALMERGEGVPEDVMKWAQFSVNHNGARLDQGPMLEMARFILSLVNSVAAQESHAPFKGTAGAAGVMVPREATDEMILAGMAAFRDGFGTPMTRYANIWKAMLAALPAQPEGGR